MSEIFWQKDYGDFDKDLQISSDKFNREFNIVPEFDEYQKSSRKKARVRKQKKRNNDRYGFSDEW